PDKVIPKLPITVMAQATVTLAVGGKQPPHSWRQDVKKLRERWNDYGIGFLLQGDFKRATQAFKRVTHLDAGWPEEWGNVGRGRLEEGSLNEAKRAFETALQGYDAAPTPLTPYQRARTQCFYAQTIRRMGQWG